jgi:hypothetical protein
MVLHTLVFGALGYAAVKLPILIFARTPRLQHRLRFMLGAIAVLFSGVIYLALHS